MKASARKILIVGLLTIANVLSFPSGSFADVLYPTGCNPNLPHCYVTRSQGISADRSTYSLSNVSEVGAWVRSDCAYLPNSSAEIETTEMWLITPQHTAANHTEPEWVETGITRGSFNGIPRGLIFYWARNYWNANLFPQAGYMYEEFEITPATPPSSGTNYSMSIKYLTSDSSWHIYKGVNSYGVSTTNVAPGLNQAAEIGAEHSQPSDEAWGEVSHMYRVAGGTTYNAFTGYIFRSPDAFTYTTTGTDELSYRTVYHTFCT